MTAHIRLWILNRFDTNTDNATDVSCIVSSFVTMSPMPKQRLHRLKNRSSSIRSVLSWCSCFLATPASLHGLPSFGPKALCRFLGSNSGFLLSGIFCLPVLVRGIVRSAPGTFLPPLPGCRFHYKGQGFSASCSTSSRSEYWNLFWMIREPSARRRGFVTFSVTLGNRAAYFSSNMSHGTLSASCAQRLSGFIRNTRDWLKSSNDGRLLSGVLYMISPGSCKNPAWK